LLTGPNDNAHRVSGVRRPSQIRGKLTRMLRRRLSRRATLGARWVAGALLVLSCATERRPALFDYGTLDAGPESDAPAFDLDSALGTDGGDCGRVVVPVVV